MGTGGTEPSSAAAGWVAGTGLRAGVQGVVTGSGGGPMRGNNVGREQIKTLLRGEGQRLPVPGERPRTPHLSHKFQEVRAMSNQSLYTQESVWC